MYITLLSTVVSMGLSLYALLAYWRLPKILMKRYRRAMMIAFSIEMFLFAVCAGWYNMIYHDYLSITVLSMISLIATALLAHAGKHQIKKTKIYQQICYQHTTGVYQ